MRNARGDFRIAFHDQVDVVLIVARRRFREHAPHEIHGGLGPHAANDADDAMHRWIQAARTCRARANPKSSTYPNNPALPPVWINTMFWPFLNRPLRIKSIKPAMPLPV